MKIWKASKLSIGFFAVLALATSLPAFAIPPSQAVFFSNGGTFAGVCCFSWGESLSLIHI